MAHALSFGEEDHEYKPTKPKECRFIFKLEGHEIVREVLLGLGWIEYDEDDHAPGQWNLWWRSSRFRYDMQIIYCSSVDNIMSESYLQFAGYLNNQIALGNESTISLDPPIH